MPVRFRCAYCNQLLGIARRKAGTVVRCPTCAGQVIVPTTDEEETEGPGGEDEPLVFERSDFEELLNPAGEKPVPLEPNPSLLTSSEAPVALPSSAEPPAGAWGTHAEPAYDVERIKPVSAGRPGGADGPGIVLSRKRAIVLLGAAVVAVVLAFTGGLLTGHYLWPAAAQQETQSGN